jgi:hypothetical protein
MSVDEIRRMPPSVGLLAYRNRRSTLLDLTGWDERRDADDIQAAKHVMEQSQQAVFIERHNARPTPGPEAVSEE